MSLTEVMKPAVLLIAALTTIPWTAFGQGTAAFSVVYAFNGSTDGAEPSIGKLVQDSGGNLYGTAQLGGDPGCDSGEFVPGCGVVFKVDPAGNETALYSFTQYTENISGLFRAADGNFYGTISSGGAFISGGAVFQVDPAGNETNLHSFVQSFSPAGFGPFGGVFHDDKGNSYGINANGGQEGDECLVTGCGVLFAIDASGNETILHTFDGSDGTLPAGPLIADKARNLYGMTQDGGTGSLGTVFKLDSSGTETVLHSFTGGSDGAIPFGAGLIEDASGNLYGTTSYGGPHGSGVVFRVDASGHETVLYAFNRLPDGANPYGGLLRDKMGNLYGTTTGGGENDAGVVFRIDPSGNETILHSFDGGTGGSGPAAGLIGRKTGPQTYELYGTTSEGGNLSCGYGEGCGIVFRLTVSGSADFDPE